MEALGSLNRPDIGSLNLEKREYLGEIDDTRTGAPDRSTAGSCEGVFLGEKLHGFVGNLSTGV